jgi:hypothetical protein
LLSSRVDKAVRGSIPEALSAMPIFISYSSKDQKSAEAICTAIENRGFACWIASRDIGPGENFQAQVVRAIRNAKIMVLVFSSNANNSEEIKKELVLAGQCRLVVIPIRVEDVTPDDAFAYEFATRQWIDVFGDWEHAIQRVIHQIEVIVGEAAKPGVATETTEGKSPQPPSEPTPAPLTPPPAPTAKQRRNTPVAARLGAAAAFIVILAGVLIWQLGPKGSQPPAPAATASVPVPAAEPAASAPPAPEHPGGQAPITIPPAPSTAENPQAPPPAAAPSPAPAPAAQPAPAPQPEPQKPAVTARQTFRDCPNCPEMVVVPAGSFQMGAAPG